MALIDTIGRALGGFGAGVAGKGSEYLQQLSEDRKNAMLEDALRVEDLLTSGDVSKARELVLDRIKNIQRLGGNPDDSMAFLKLLDAGDVQTAITEARSLVDYGVSQGRIKRPAEVGMSNWAYNQDLQQFVRTNPNTGALEFMDLNDQQRQALESRQTTDQTQFQQGTGAMAGYAFNPVTGMYTDTGKRPLVKERDGNLDEIRKEVRSRTGKGFSSLADQATVVETNFKKLDNLSSEIRKGSRSAVVPAIVAMVKLGDPTSVVSQEEVRSALNNEAPISALASLFREKGVNGGVIDAVLTKLDPTAPENINVDEMMATAQGLLTANIGSIQTNYADTYQVASDNLTADGLRSVLPKNLGQRINALSNLNFGTAQTRGAGAPAAPTAGGSPTPPNAGGSPTYMMRTKDGSMREVTQSEIDAEAKRYGITPEQVISDLGLQRK